MRYAIGLSASRARVHPTTQPQTAFALREQMLDGRCSYPALGNRVMFSAATLAASDLRRLAEEDVFSCPRVTVFAVLAWSAYWAER